MSDVEFEKLDDAIAYAIENGDIGPVFLWASEHQYEDMTQADAEKIVEVVWDVFDKVKDDEYDPNQQYMASALDCVAQWAVDESASVDLKLANNFEAYIQRCVVNDDIVEAMNIGLVVRKNGDIEFYKKLTPFMLDKANSEWGWSGEDHEPGIKQMLTLHDLTKDQADSIIEIAKTHSTKKVLKDIMSEYEWRSESDAGDYGSFHEEISWQTSTME